jgi:hypothetical protein
LPFVFPCFATGAPSPFDCLLCVCKELKHLLWVLVPSLSFVLFPMWLALYMVFFDCVSPLRICLSEVYYIVPANVCLL